MRLRQLSRIHSPHLIRVDVDRDCNWWHLLRIPARRLWWWGFWNLIRDNLHRYRNDREVTAAGASVELTGHDHLVQTLHNKPICRRSHWHISLIWFEIEFHVLRLWADGCLPFSETGEFDRSDGVGAGPCLAWGLEVDDILKRAADVLDRKFTLRVIQFSE